MDRYYQLTPLIPRFTPSTAPLEFPMVTENGLLVDVEIVVPTGHVGLTGIRILQSRQQIIPWGNLSWVSGDGYSRVFLVDNEVGADSLTVQAFNDDSHQHEFQLRFHLRDLAANDPAEPSPTMRAAESLLQLSSTSVQS